MTLTLNLSLWKYVKIIYSTRVKLQYFPDVGKISEYIPYLQNQERSVQNIILRAR